jgi:DNA-binding CsgD family transcriptional regulator
MLQGFATPPSEYPSDILSRRQADVVQLAAAGLTAKQTAVRLGISRYTVNEYVQSAKRRIGAATKAELVAWAVASGMLRHCNEPST